VLGSVRVGSGALWYVGVYRVEQAVDGLRCRIEKSYAWRLTVGIALPIVLGVSGAVGAEEGARMAEASLCFGNAGWYVEWFAEDDSAPMGYRTATWYGSR